MKTTTNDGHHRNLVKRLWAGEISLVKTFWIYGGLIPGCARLIVVFLFSAIPSKSAGPLIVTCLAALTLYQVFICVAIWRSARSYKTNPANKTKFYGTLAQFMVFFGILGNLGQLGFIGGAGDRKLSQSELQKEVQAVNNGTPKMIADGLRLDGVALSSQSFVYNYTLVGLMRDNLSPQSKYRAVSRLRAEVAHTVCSNKLAKPLLSSVSKMLFTYKSEDGSSVLQTDIMQDDCLYLGKSLTEARRSFRTTLGQNGPKGHIPPDPPAGSGTLVHYWSDEANLSAYISRWPVDGRKRPAMIWIHGGDTNSIGESVWENAPVDNDQTARAFRDAGIVTMYPTLRGGNDNPGRREGFYGEVDDIIAAANYLSKQPGIDPERIYLGGHSTGGTLALLVAEMSSRFRAVFSFGPVEDPSIYPKDYFNYDTANRTEMLLRTPIYWLDSVQGSLFVFEGASNPCNIESLQAFEETTSNKLIHFHGVRGANHFSILAKVSSLIAQKIIQDTGKTPGINFDPKELDGLFAR